MAILEGGGGVDFLWIPYCLEHLVSMAFALTNFHRISIEWWVVWVDLTAYLVDLLGFRFLEGNNGSIFSLWIMNSGSTPGTSYGLQANISKFCIKVSNTATRSSKDILLPTWNHLFSWGSILTLIRSSALAAPLPSMSSYNCYDRSYSVGSFYLISWLIAVTKHCFATCRSPFTTKNPPLVWNFTFTCKVDGTTPIAWIHSCTRIVM